MKKDNNEKKYKDKKKVDKYIPSISIKKIPPEKALAILRKAGYDIDADHSEEVMEFLYTIAKLTLKEFFISD